MLEAHYFHAGWIQPSGQELETDVCVYGGTAAGIAAAVALARLGRRVVLLQPGRHLGGMTTGGLGRTDAGKQYVIGGLARDFYRQLGAYYGRAEEWEFEPHAAQLVLDRWLADTDVTVLRAQYLDRAHMQGNRIVAITMLGGLTVRAKAFIDTTYEGDLMAAAGVRFTVGREGNDVYGETLNGAQIRRWHQFTNPVDPYIIPGDRASGTLPYIDDEDAAPTGTGDHRIQAYCFRMCMTDRPDLARPWRKPADFDPRLYVLATRWYQSEKHEDGEILLPDGELRKFDRLSVRHKTDTNNFGAISSDFIGANYDWPAADHAQREKIFQHHRSYQEGLYWLLCNDPSIPKRYREAHSRWGMAGDEFADTGHWPHQLYVREARRMVADHVLTEHVCMHRQPCEDPVGMGSYNLDSHNCRRIVRDGRVLNEGDVQVPPAGPYGISYRAVVPARGQCENLAVPVCLSSSHIAYGSIRMEPVFMILGQSVAIAIDMAMKNGAALQDVPYNELKPQLLLAGQVLTTAAATADA